MGLTKCRECFSTILDIAATCPRCGDPQAKPAHRPFPFQLLALVTASSSIVMATAAVLAIHGLEKHLEEREAAFSRNPPPLFAPAATSLNASVEPASGPNRHYRHFRRHAGWRHHPDGRPLNSGMAGRV